MSWMFPKPLTAFLTLNSMNDNWSSSMGIGNPKQLVIRIPIRKQSNLGTSMDFHSHCCIEIPSTGNLSQSLRLAAESKTERLSCREPIVPMSRTIGSGSIFLSPKRMMMMMMVHVGPRYICLCSSSLFCYGSLL